MNNITAFIPDSPDRISMAALSAKIGCTDRETRKYVSTAREAGEIIASDENGYHIASVMSRTPSWMPDIQIRGDGYEDVYYRKD